MVTIHLQGRLGNNLLQFFAAYFFSKKHKLPLFISDLSPFYNNGNTQLGNIISNYQGSYVVNSKEQITVNDENFFDYYNHSNLPDANYYLSGYFQFKELIAPLRSNIKDILNIKYTDQSNAKVFIHYRLGDVQNSNLMLPLEYYIEAMEILGRPAGYISSDTIEHENCQFLIKNYGLSPIQMDPWTTILFAKNFDKLILSEGTFSVIIGLLSNASKIVCNMRETEWGGGDLCSGFDEYIKLQYTYRPYPTIIRKSS